MISDTNSSLVIARHASPLVVRPFRVVQHEAKASHYIFKLCSVILHFDFSLLTFFEVSPIYLNYIIEAY